MMGPRPDGVNIRYVTGFEAPDPFAVIWNGRDVFMAVPSMEQGRASEHTSIDHIFSLQELKMKPDDTVASAVAQFARKLDIRAVAVSSDFPWSGISELRRRKIRIESAGKRLETMRACKSRDEMRCIRKSQRAAARAMRAARSLIAASDIRGGWLFYREKKLTSECVKKAILQSLLDDQCSGENTIVACGRHAADPHHEGRGPLRAGAPIVVDIFPRSREHGYWGDLTRTFVRGRAPKELKSMYRAVREAQRLALNRIKAGAWADAIHRDVCRFFESEGFPPVRNQRAPEGFIHGTGHGVGLEIHEEPRISMRHVRLQRGHVVTVEPGLYYRRIGGVRMEDTVRVTENGWEPLARAPVTLEI